MKHFLVLFLLIWSTPNLFGQKTGITPFLYDKISYCGGRCISNNGKYIAYEIKRGHQYPGTSQKLIIQSTLTDWKLEISKAAKSVGEITNNSRYWLFLTRTDSLGIVDLESKSVKYFPNVSSFVIPDNDSNQWLVYELNNNKGTIILHNLTTGQERRFSNISLYKLGNEGKNLILLHISQKDPEKRSVVWINLVNGKNVLVSKEKSINNLIVDFRHQQLAFKADDSIFYYKKGMSVPVLVFGPEMMNNDVRLKLDDLDDFSSDGKRIHLTLIKPQRPITTNKPDGLEIWSYYDYPLQSVQDKEIQNSGPSYKAVIQISNHNLIQLQDFSGEILDGLYDNFALGKAITSRDAYIDGGLWNIAETRRIFFIINTKTGERKELPWLKDVNNSGENARISPRGKYVLCYIPKDKAYLSYNVETEEIVNLTSAINTKWIPIEMEDHILQNPRGIAGWLPDDKAVLIYDQNDIWKLDPSGNTAPVNLTHGYGLKNHVIFKLAIESDNDSISLKDNSLLLSAFNVENKNSGFYTINLYGGKDPKECCMGPYIYKQSTPFMPGMDEIIKARNKNIYIVQRMSAKEPANYFYTTDFKNFTRITNFNLEKEYNWYTTELLSWKSLDGRKLQGILYKPENFDANKKYPVIFYCYERLSDRLNAYLEPEYSQGSMDIATYVSNGYLVFTPDIYYRIGDPLQGSYDAVVSAAQYVSTFPFVNSKKMGLQGHSFGAIQINYLITHTSLFAAACSASGISNFVSGYGSLEGNSFEGYNGGLAGLYETGQNRMGSTLWGNLKGYVKNSSIFQVDKVTTPLLMMHTKKDEICPYANAMEFFLGLRRLGKKVWMLVYPEGKHSVLGKESEDFTIRMQQFFDYYLKDKPAPIWMLEGTKEKDTGIKYALDLDVLGRTPGPSLLTPEEEKKVDNLMTREAITITIR